MSIDVDDEDTPLVAAITVDSRARPTVVEAPAVTEAPDVAGKQLSFDNIHEEPAAEQLSTSPAPPAAQKPPRRKVVFEKTAGARATRSQNVQMADKTSLRGLGTSAGFAMLALGSSLSTAVYAMGTTDLFGEPCKPDGTLKSSLSAALAKPSTVDPKNQAEAYRRDKDGWQKSEAKELTNHKANGSWEYIDRSALPRGRRLVKLVWV